MTTYEHKAATFNGNIVTGKGDTPEKAYEQACNAAHNIGSCIRKTISVREFDKSVGA
ncbi:MAG: hypothetical protein ACO3VR_14620 [Lutimaribacter sp.]